MTECAARMLAPDRRKRKLGEMGERSAQSGSDPSSPRDRDDDKAR